MTIEKGLIGKEDINFGTNTAQRKGQSGSLINITQVRASHLPIEDSGAKFTGTDVEAALQECQVEDGSGSDAKDYTNQSGVSRSVGDVVIVSTAAVNSFTTTTTAGNSSVLGVVGEAIGIAAAGKVITGGYVATLAVDAATTIGSFLKTSTTAGKASPSATATGGSFAIALSSTAGAGNVSAFIFGTVGQDYLPLSGGNITGTLGLKKGSDIVAASTLNPWASSNSGNYFDVTGSTGITAISANSVGTVITLHFDASPTLTHHATNLILPGGVNWVAGAGDELTFVEYATGQWRMVGHVTASLTGTGGFVKATSPTLVTPKVDTIDEATVTNGVVIDGLKIKDNYPVGVNATSGIKEASIDWANAGGIGQFLLSAQELTNSLTSFTDLLTCKIYIPENANTLEYYMYMKSDAVYVPHARLQIGATNGTDLSVGTTTAYLISALGTLDISAVSGWQNLDIQGYVTNVGGAVYVREVWVRII